MKRPKNNYLTSRMWLTGAAATLAAFPGDPSVYAVQPGAPPRAGEYLPVSLNRFSFYREGILGTSFELQVAAARGNDARVCEQQVLAEIERLRLLLSPYDPGSEISRVRAGTAPAGPELAALFAAYGLWGERTGGALDLNLAEVIRLWKEAGATPPAAELLARALAQPRAYNVDALGKGYIIDRAVEVARRFADNGLLNIGGDIRVWGVTDWSIGVANPLAPAENSPPLVGFNLRNGAVATSGDYSRFVTVAGERRSHILDPRTLEPARLLRSATMVAADCLTANALSTAANVLGMVEGVRLAKRFSAWDHLLVDLEGRMEGSLARMAVTADAPAAPSLEQKTVSEGTATTVTATAPATTATPAAGVAWPTNFQVKINVNLKAISGGRARRPYVAVWVMDTNKKLVRTLTVWGSDWRWLRELYSWWQAGDSYTDAFTRSITRATRAPGNYVLVWDGLNDKKQPVPQGEYKVFMELNREHGRHVTESVAITCGAEAQTVEFRATPESEVSKVEFGPKTP
jgi:FAD:protein FMN transferase